jgi:hypothetical protein
MGQDITQISPTLGFDIQTLEYKELILKIPLNNAGVLTLFMLIDLNSTCGM